jgi:hypothetical protein
LACGVRDILGTRLIETPSHLVYVGVHQQIGRSLGADVEPVMKELTSPLRSAMLRQMERLFGSTQSKPNPKVSARRIRYYFHGGNGGNFWTRRTRSSPRARKRSRAPQFWRRN